MQKWEKFSDEELLNFLKTSNSYAEVLRKLGYKPYSSMNYIVKNIEEKLNYQIELSGLKTKEEDILGTKYGFLTVIELDKEKSKEKQRAWVRAKCVCGKEIVISLNALKKGNTKSCGCKTKILSRESKGRNLVDQRFGRLLVLYPIEDNRKETYWKCQCDCGNVIEATHGNLVSGNTKSCGCLQKDIMREKKLIDLTGKRFGYLTALERDDSKQQGHKTYWKCQCDCGNITYVQTAMLNNGNTSSCGCKKSSYGEKQIEDILLLNNITFQKQYSFSDLKGQKNFLKFDFAVFKDNELKYLIECNGRQHYKKVEYFQNDEEFAQQINYDNRKKEYCKLHNIPLVIIDFSKNRLIKQEEVIKGEFYGDN